MAIVTYSANSVIYQPDADSEESFTHEIDFRGNDSLLRNAAAVGIYKRAEANLATEKKGKPWRQAHEMIQTEIERMIESGSLDKEATEGGRRGPAYVDQLFIQALVNAGPDFAENLSDATATFVSSVHEEGYRTKAEVAERVKALCEKYPELGAAYAALMSEGAASGGRKL